jgi:hypothetical protein
MVAKLEVAFLIIGAVVGLWWFSRTSRFRSRRRIGEDPQGRGDRPESHLDPPNHGFNPDNGSSW